MSELVILSAADEPALIGEMTRLIDFLNRVPDVSLLNIAYTCSLMRGPARIALVVPSVDGLRSRLILARDRLAVGTVRRIRDKSGTYYVREHLMGAGGGKLAFVYPGVVSFYPDMLRDLAIARPECRDVFDELEEAMKDNADFTPSSFIFPPAPYYRHDADIFKSGAYAQALVSTYAACAALSRLLVRTGLRPDGVVGLAGGDLAAMMRSGAAGAEPSRPDRVAVIRDIYKIVAKAVNHGGLPTVSMIGVLLRHPGEIDELVKTFPPDKVVLAVDYSPRQKTYAIAPEFEATALAAFAAAGVRTIKLALDKPFNTPLVSSLVPEVRKFATTWMKNKPVYDIYSCASAARLAGSIRASRTDTAERWARPIRFEETIRRMYEDGYRVFLEVGPQSLATAAIDDTLKGLEHAAIPMNSIHRTGVIQAQHAVAQLVAQGAEMNISHTCEERGARRLDFNAAISLEVRKYSEKRLSRAFPRLTLLSTESLLPGIAGLATEAKGRGVRANQRKAADELKKRRERQFDFGAMNPLVSDADRIAFSQGIALEIAKVFKLSEVPFLSDYALGTSQMSYSDLNLRGLILLSIPVGAEIMAETASQLAPNRTLVRIEDFECRRMVSIDRGEIRLFVKADHVTSGNLAEMAFKVQLRDDAPNGAYTWPVMEATFVFAAEMPPVSPSDVEPLMRPRNVHWSGREIYPARLCLGARLRGVTFVDSWSETGLDYEVAVPDLAGNLVFTRFPLWVVNPLLLEIIASGFVLWRSHEKFAGAFSFPFRFHRLDLLGFVPKEGAKLKCYLRLTGVTPKSHLCDITATDGNGQALVRLTGWEELTERVPDSYRAVVQQPATSFISEPLHPDILGDPATDVASAYVTDVPYPIFERNEELWLRILSRIVLNGDERKRFMDMTGSVSRRTEWLFGRIVAKEAVRRYLKDFYQARWSDADVLIWADPSGKPHALGDWNEYLATKLDIAIAHTAQFVVAIAAANARVGVDVESAMRVLSDEFAEGVFVPEERELFAQSANASLMALRFWCAKEAVSKALGTGIRYSPKELRVADYQGDSGALLVRLEGAWLEAFKDFKGRDIRVTTKLVRDHVVASCFIPAALFRD